METKVYKELANRIQARANCKKAGNTEWFDKHTAIAEWIISHELPHGSGLDGTWRLAYDKSNENRVVLYMEYHAMNEVGFYDGWIDFSVTLTGSLAHNFDMVIRGNFGRHQDIKEYLYDILTDAFNASVDTENVRILAV